MKKKEKTERPNDRKTQSRDLSRVELQQLADAAGCSVSYVSRVFSRSDDPKQRRGLTFDRAHAFASYLGVTLDDLWKMLSR
jgi:membrane-bound lytic murein transglycosylase MltF